MVALQRLSRAEKYLLAILNSPNGIDLAEFAFTDVTRSHGRYRLHDYQHAWFACNDRYQVDQSARSVGKSESIKLRAAAMPFARRGRGMLLTAPELNHLQPITSAVQENLEKYRILREMRPKGKAGGIRKQPHWEARFKNGSHIISRLPNLDGRGVKGQHVDVIELDEAQNYPKAGWVEVVETLNAGQPGSMWRCHGVSTGARDSFFEKSQPDSGWTVHRIMACHRPTWSEEERQAKIVEYGGTRQAIDFKRNIYGEHGDASSPVFVLSRLMQCIDTNKGSRYNTEIYSRSLIMYEKLPDGAGDEERWELLRSWISVPEQHLVGWSQKTGKVELGSPRGYSGYFAGMDVGVTNHPSEILVFGQRMGSEFLELLLRVQLQRINTDDQKAVVRYLFATYGEKLSIGIDRNGVGFPIFDQLRREEFGSRVLGFHDGENRICAVEDRPLETGEKPEDLIKMRPVIESATDWLRNNHVDAKQLLLPYDLEIVRQFQGQTSVTIKDSGSPYGIKRQFSGGGLHALDAAKYALACRYIGALEELVNSRPKVRKPVLDLFVGSDW